MPVTLATGIDAVLDGIVLLLQAEQGTGRLLSDVLIVARGDRAEPAPDTPAVYVAPGKMSVTDPTTSQNEWWEMPVTLTAMVTCDSDVLPFGYKQATDIAARARAVLLTINSGNLNLPYVRQIRSAAFDPAGPWSLVRGRSEGVFYPQSTAEIRVLFSVRG